MEDDILQMAPEENLKNYLILVIIISLKVGISINDIKKVYLKKLYMIMLIKKNNKYEVADIN